MSTDKVKNESYNGSIFCSVEDFLREKNVNLQEEYHSTECIPNGTKVKLLKTDQGGAVICICDIEEDKKRAALLTQARDPSLQDYWEVIQPPDAPDKEIDDFTITTVESAEKSAYIIPERDLYPPLIDRELDHECDEIKKHFQIARELIDQKKANPVYIPVSQQCIAVPKPKSWLQSFQKRLVWGDGTKQHATFLEIKHDKSTGYTITHIDPNSELKSPYPLERFSESMLDIFEGQVKFKTLYLDQQSIGNKNCAMYCVVNISNALSDNSVSKAVTKKDLCVVQEQFSQRVADTEHRVYVPHPDSGRGSPGSGVDAQSQSASPLPRGDGYGAVGSASSPPRGRSGSTSSMGSWVECTEEPQPTGKTRSK